MPDDVRRIADLLVEDPALAGDLLRWIESSRAVGADGVFAGYREAPVAGTATGSAPRPVARRACGQGTNRLYRADNLAVLRDLVDSGVRARCVYIDPPYGTRQQFARKATDHTAYCDAASGAAHLAALRARLILLRDVLADDGSLFVHLDASMVAAVKTLLDELFGASNFRAWITRRKCSSKNYTRRSFGDIADYVLFYTKTGDYLFNRQFDPRTPEQEAIDFPKVDAHTGRRFALVPIHAQGRRNGATGGPWRGMLPPAGKHWQWTPDKLDECAARGDIYWTRNGTPRRKVWADESAGSSVSNLWLDFRDPFNQNFATTGYPSEKNLDLLRRIVASASEPGDLVLDAYAGSGTTLAAASALGRRWIGIDSGELAVALAQKRLAAQVLAAGGEDLGFEVWSSEEPSREVVHAPAEGEFAFVERVPAGGAVPRVHEVLEAPRVPERLAALGTDERLVAFDHGGREAVCAEPADGPLPRRVRR
jgi:adenine-specific DNA-methyltransferase